MKTIAALAVSALAVSGSGSDTANPAKPADQQMALTCFKTGEQISGMNKICYYDCLGSGTAITVSSIDLCPLSIQQ